MNNNQIELEILDANCNNCKFMVRDLEKFNRYNKLNEGVAKAGRVCYGNCTKLNKDVSFIPNTCQIHTQDCFEHRKI